MNAQQPNFERLKTILYRFIINSNEYEFSLLGGEFKSMYDKRKESRVKINEIIDRLDIRGIQEPLSRLPLEYLPSWYKNKKFVIDYNKHGFLDFIKTT